MSFWLKAAGAAGAYLLAVKPSSRRDWMKQFAGHYYAHRGLYDNTAGVPENSCTAFRRAVEHGYGIELDVQLSKDGIPVVFHDDTLPRMAKDKTGGPVHGYVSDYTFSQLREFHLLDTDEKIPTLQEVLDIVHGEVPLIVEMKTHGKDHSCPVCAAADRLLQNYRGLYVVESFNPFAIRWYQKNRPDVIRGQLSDAYTKQAKYRRPSYFASEYLLYNFLVKPDFIAYNSKHAGNLSREITRRLYRVPSVAWTIQSDDELNAMQKRYDLFIFEAFMPKKKEN